MSDKDNTLEFFTPYVVTFDAPLKLRLSISAADFVDTAVIEFYETSNGYICYRKPGEFGGYLADTILEHMVSAKRVYPDPSKLGHQEAA